MLWPIFFFIQPHDPTMAIRALPWEWNITSERMISLCAYIDKQMQAGAIFPTTQRVPACRMKSSRNNQSCEMLGGLAASRLEFQGSKSWFLKLFHLSYDTFPATWANTCLSANIFFCLFCFGFVTYHGNSLIQPPSFSCFWWRQVPSPTFLP